MSETLRCDHCGEVDLKGTPDVRYWLRLERVEMRWVGLGGWTERHFCSQQCLAHWANTQPEVTG